VLRAHLPEPIVPSRFRLRMPATPTLAERLAPMHSAAQAAATLLTVAAAVVGIPPVAEAATAAADTGIDRLAPSEMPEPAITGSGQTCLTLKCN
jgi:hypothetical protein